MPGMNLDESARRLGGLVWTERRLFELLGGWVVSTPEPDIKLALAHTSRRHGDHALTLGDLLPDTRDHDPESLVAPPDGGDGAFAAAAAAATTAERLDAVEARIAPAHLGALEAYLADASPVRDGPAIRVVGAVLAEDAAALGALAALLGN
jgi:hypothetical protein